MVIRTAAVDAPHPEAVEFVRFCYHRRRVGWPELYDEMCAVAGRGLFRGFSSDDLGGIGVGFSLFDMPALASLAARVVAEEVALRRPMSVAIAPAPAAATSSVWIASASSSSTAPQAEPATVAASGAPAAVATPADERSFDVTVRLALAPTVA
jgi:predicted lipid-binding transport protein (Tim44 family)